MTNSWWWSRKMIDKTSKLFIHTKNIKVTLTSSLKLCSDGLKFHSFNALWMWQSSWLLSIVTVTLITDYNINTDGERLIFSSNLPLWLKRTKTLVAVSIKMKKQFLFQFFANSWHWHWLTEQWAVVSPRPGDSTQWLSREYWPHTLHTSHTPHLNSLLTQLISYNDYSLSPASQPGERNIRNVYQSVECWHR